MKVLYPEVFWLFIPVALLFLPAFFNYQRGKQSLLRLGGLWRKDESYQVYFIKTLTYWISMILFFVFAILALAGISWGKDSGKDDSLGVDLVMAADVSRSMLADDLTPSRLNRASEGMSFILNSFESLRTALVVFKGKGEILVPLTEDSIQMETALQNLSPGMYSVPGSDIEMGLMSALQAFPPGSPGKKAVLLVSDGESLEGEPRNAAREAYLRGIPIFVLGVGTEEGIVLRDRNNEVVSDMNGQAVITSLNRQVLEDLADLSGGGFYSLSDPRSLGELTADLEELIGLQEAEGILYSDHQQFRLFILLALVFLVLNLVAGGIRWSKWF